MVTGHCSSSSVQAVKVRWCHQFLLQSPLLKLPPAAYEVNLFINYHKVVPVSLTNAALVWKHVLISNVLVLNSVQIGLHQSTSVEQRE